MQLSIWFDESTLHLVRAISQPWRPVTAGNIVVAILRGCEWLATFVIIITASSDYDKSPFEPPRPLDGIHAPWIFYPWNLAMLGNFFFLTFANAFAILSPVRFERDDSPELPPFLKKLGKAAWVTHTLSFPALQSTLIIASQLRPYITYHQPQEVGLILIYTMALLDFLLTNVPLMPAHAIWQVVMVILYQVVIVIYQASVNGIMYPTLHTVGQWIACGPVLYLGNYWGLSAIKLTREHCFPAKVIRVA